MLRRTAIVGIVLLACLSTLWLAAAHVLARDRDAAEHELARDRLQTLTGAASALGADLAGIGKDLALAATLIEQAPSADSAERELHAIAAIKREYLAFEIRTAGGGLVRFVAADAPRAVQLAATPVVARMIEVARRSPDELHISPGLSDGDDVTAWYRVFARKSSASAVTVTAVIDMRVLVAPPELLRAGPSRLLVLSAHGVPAPASDPVMTALVQDAVTGADLRALLDGARTRLPGVRIIDAATAQHLGLPAETAVATAVPIPIDAGAPWVLMLVTSSESLTARHHALVSRIALGAGLGLLLVAGAVLYIVRNARRAAALRERLHHAELLAHLTEKADKILEHIPSAVLALDANGTVTACNHWFGEARDTVVGRSLADVLSTAPEEHVRTVVSLVESARAAEAPRTLRRARIALRGTDAYVTLHAIPLANAFRDVASLLVVEDESALQRTEDRLIRSEKLATAGQLAAGIAHEIGTPLGVARGRAEMTLLRGRADEVDLRNLRTIVERIDYVARLIEQLLDYLRPRGAQIRAIDASQSFQVVADLLEPQAASREVRLAIDLPAVPPEVHADPDQLQQLLVNLVMNAIDACEPGGHVTMRARRQPGAVVLEVTDDGCGIRAEDRAHVFDPFFTTKRRGQGTGLGLWVVAQLARAHDAEVEVDSRVDAGSTFRVVWPDGGNAA